MEQAMATAKDTRVRNRNEYLKEWRKKNVEHIQEYVVVKYGGWAGRSRMYKERNPGKVLFNSAKRRAKDKNFEFNIEVSDINIPTMCPILDIPILKVYTEGKKSGPTPNSASVDRIDNNKGYVKGNVQVISHLANTMKASASPEELVKFAKWILKTYEAIL
jgi:hypothetical protein